MKKGRRQDPKDIKEKGKIDTSKDVTILDRQDPLRVKRPMVDTRTKDLVTISHPLRHTALDTHTLSIDNPHLNPGQ